MSLASEGVSLQDFAKDPVGNDDSYPGTPFGLRTPGFISVHSGDRLIGRGVNPQTGIASISVTDNSSISQASRSSRKERRRCQRSIRRAAAEHGIWQKTKTGWNLLQREELLDAIIAAETPDSPHRGTKSIRRRSIDIRSSIHPSPASSSKATSTDGQHLTPTKFGTSISRVKSGMFDFLRRRSRGSSDFRESTTSERPTIYVPPEMLFDPPPSTEPTISSMPKMPMIPKMPFQSDTYKGWVVDCGSRRVRIATERASVPKVEGQQTTRNRDRNQSAPRFNNRQTARNQDRNQSASRVRDQRVPKVRIQQPTESQDVNHRDASSAQTTALSIPRRPVPQPRARMFPGWRPGDAFNFNAPMQPHHEDSMVPGPRDTSIAPSDSLSSRSNRRFGDSVEVSAVKKFCHGSMVAFQAILSMLQHIVRTLQNEQPRSPTDLALAIVYITLLAGGFVFAAPFLEIIMGVCAKLLQLVTLFPLWG